MLYEKRQKFIIPAEYRQEVLDMLMERKDESGLSSKKVKELVIYMKPMTKARWISYLSFEEMDQYLVAADSDDLGI